MIARLRACLAAVALGLAPLSAGGQSLNFASGTSDSPIEVDAREGIEWRQDDRLFIARGDAVATRDEVAVRADTLRAYYREKATGGTDIWRLDADGNVTIASPTETATGTSAVYDVDNAILVLKGAPARLVTPDDVITARDQLEYWERDRMAVARGGAEAERGVNRMRADVLVGRFAADGKGGSRIERIEAYGNVVVITPNETVRAARGVYAIATEVATLEGPVKITRGDNQLNGCRARVDMKTGVSRLMSCAPGEGGQRVRGLLVPDGVKK